MIDRIYCWALAIFSLMSDSVPSMSGIVLTIDTLPEKSVRKLVDGFHPMPLPIISTKEDTLSAVRKVDNMYPRILPDDQRKIASAIGLFSQCVDVNTFLEKMKVTKSKLMTPRMFEHFLIDKAKRHIQRIVLPEGTDERVLKAAEILVRRNVADLAILGPKDRILAAISSLGLELDEDQVDIIEPATHPSYKKYAEIYYDMRKHKGGTLDTAYETLADETYFGTMMVYMGDADGMVSGAIHTIQDTIRPAFQIIHTKPDLSIVSSVFFMCLSDRVLVYGDCGVNPRPTSEGLAEIAIVSERNAAAFGIWPNVALLSYSTGPFGRGEEVDRIKKAVEIIRKRCPEMKMEGPIQ
uniref:Phosphate acetyltransferase n=1 Tax=Candidatus Kentrum sp. FW TaxID=2126338 RepID=A0A450TLR3_9GAMM|nr:MAG: phosphate acetyltransferase [Candidatus Kentron sp. FW]